MRHDSPTQQARKDYEEYGYEFGTAGSRLATLGEALPRIKRRWERLNPRPSRKIPILVGGGGERKTLHYTAEHADIWHGFGGADTMMRKSAILDRWCAQVGRDPSQIERSTAVNRPPDDVAEGLLKAGITLFTIGISGPSYNLTLARRWIAWRNDYNST